ADAVRSPTYREMNRLLEANQLDEKLVSLFSTPRPEIELYAWREDLNCLDNLNRDENRRAVTEKLLGQLSLWQSKTADSFPGVDQLTPDGFDRVTGERLE
ncbi:MAG: heparan N-sulfatase, partial [Planctomycetota bacterium]|nr:heparan N-sulfatase [Planctomycetota bacterium]